MGDNKLQAGKFLTCKTVGFKTALYGLSAICKELAGNSLKSKKKKLKNLEKCGETWNVLILK